MTLGQVHGMVAPYPQRSMNWLEIFIHPINSSIKTACDLQILGFKVASGMQRWTNINVPLQASNH